MAAKKQQKPQRGGQIEGSQTVEELHYHRNGISGYGFFVGRIKLVEDGVARNMLVVRFPKETDKATGGVMCAAFDLDLLKKDTIAFFDNSWRGDHFSAAMDEAIAAREREQERKRS